MDHPPNLAEEAAESVNPGDQGLPALNPSKSVRSESHAPIDMVKRHGAEEFHGSNMEEFNKDEF